MELKLASPNGDIDETYSIEVIATDSDIDILLEAGKEKAKAMGDELPTWSEGNTVDAILGNASTHFMLLPNQAYLSIS